MNTKRHPQILIAEDDTLISELMKRIIEIEDHWQPTAVNSGRDAIDAWNNREFDVIIMDLRMPLMDGIEATKLIREQEERSGRKRTPIIAFTALPGKENRRRCFDAGMDDYMEKPSSITEVVDIIYKHLSP